MTENNQMVIMKWECRCIVKFGYLIKKINLQVAFNI